MAHVPQRGQHEETVFVNGRILTMDGPVPSYVEAVVIREGRVAFVGAEGSARERFPGAVVRDLAGAALLPGFIDPHSHFMWAIDVATRVNVSSPPVGPCADIASVIAEVRRFADERAIPPGEFVVGWGYDSETLAEGRNITVEDLDPVFPDHPVVLIHVSGHGAVMNSRALEWAGIDASTPTPAGGVIARLDGSDEPAGLLMETAWLPSQEHLPKPSLEARLDLLHPAQQMYAEWGYTHAQDGFAHVADMEFLVTAADQGRLYLDVAQLGSFLELDKWKDDPRLPIGAYRNGLRIAGMKAAHDGSPQGKTAYVTEPYLTGGPSGEPGWVGEPTTPYENLAATVKKALDAGLQVFVHANGDAAIDEVIRAVRDAGVTAADDRRTVVIHSQFQRPDHLDSYLEYGLVPSYFTNHAYYWGDVHLANLGPERAAFISPMRTAAERGIVVSNHSDFTVTPLDTMFILWTAMARTSRTGQVIGADERVDAYAALQALTTGAAHQMFEEDRKGRIAEGLLADFVILSADPVEAGVDAVRDIQVLETIKEGVSVYQRE